ncbi:pyridoxal 5'-phosphate synthase [Lentzea sp. JNUCC 0626]|uniref:pyridoxal 5'-phosphate synthase n=1 Tax=Lentzea sp. JNUCC 0626 TaxID=3367513 RepID=UPI003749E36B
MAVNTGRVPLGAEFSSPPPHPIPLLREWFDLAAARQVREPGAMALATVSWMGSASSRMIQLSRITDQGIAFATHTGSRKGIELDQTRTWAGTFYWRETNQQISLSGYSEQLDDTEADALWSARPVEANAMSAATRQSEPLTDEVELLGRARSLAEGGDPARPATWIAYELVVTEAEFWQSSPDRLYRRLRYELTEEGWISERLQP